MCWLLLVVFGRCYKKVRLQQTWVVCRQILQNANDFSSPKEETRLQGLSDSDPLTSCLNKETQPYGKDQIKSTAIPPSSGGIKVGSVKLRDKYGDKEGEHG